MLRLNSKKTVLRWIFFVQIPKFFRRNFVLIIFGDCENTKCNGANEDFQGTDGRIDFREVYGR